MTSCNFVTNLKISPHCHAGLVEQNSALAHLRSPVRPHPERAPAPWAPRRREGLPQPGEEGPVGGGAALAVVPAVPRRVPYAGEAQVTGGGRASVVAAAAAPVAEVLLANVARPDRHDDGQQDNDDGDYDAKDATASSSSSSSSSASEEEHSSAPSYVAENVKNVFMPSGILSISAPPPLPPPPPRPPPPPPPRPPPLASVTSRNSSEATATMSITFVLISPLSIIS